MNEIKMVKKQPLVADEELNSCASKEPFALQVLGDSMEPEFPDGCIIIIEPARVAEPGNYVIAEIPHEGLIFRRLLIEEEQLILCAVNTEYPRHPLPDMHAIRGIVVQRAVRRSRHRKHYL